MSEDQAQESHAPPLFLKRKRLLLILAFLVALGGGAGGFLYLRLSHSSSPASSASSATDNRHGLPGDIPLPANSAFVKMARSDAAQEWLYTVPLAPDEVSSFYAAQLPGNGWTLSAAGAPGSRSVLHAMKGDRSLAVASSAQAGETLLSILLS